MKNKYILKGSVSLAEETDKIKAVADKLGIILPSTHTALFKSVYAKIEEANGNGVRLAKDAVESSLQGLIGSQVNLEHLGKGFIVGIILDAWLNADQEIEVVFTFAKNIYQEDYIRALEKMQEGDLSVSFELMTEKESVEKLPDNTVRLHDIDWQGMGLLIDAPPAYKKAKVYDLATLIKERATKVEKEFVYACKIVESCDKMIKAYMIDTDGLSMGVTSVKDRHFHVYKLNETGNDGKTIATFGDDENHVHEVKDGFIMEAEGHTHDFMDQVLANKVAQEKQEQKEQNQGGVKIMTEEQKKLVAQLRAELEGHIPEGISDDDLLVDAKVEEIRKAKKEKEEAYKRTTEVNQKTEVQDNGVTSTTKETTTVTDTVDWEAKAKENEIKLTEANAIVEAQKKEIETLKSENETFKVEAKARADKEKADKLASIKKELASNKFVKDFTDEDYLNEAKVKEVKILQENADLKAKVEALEKNGKTNVQATKSDALITASENPADEDIHTIINQAFKKN